MGKWQEGVYNSNYVLNRKGLISQLKFESSSDPGRLDEVSVERYDNGEACLVFTTNPDAVNDSKQGSDHARIDYNSLFQDLQTRFKDPELSFMTTNDEVHYLRATKGNERLLLLALTRLEQYDNSLAEIRKTLQNELSPRRARIDEIKDAIDSQKDRLELLRTILEKEQKVLGASRKRSRSVTKAKRRTSRASGTRKKARRAS